MCVHLEGKDVWVRFAACCALSRVEICFRPYIGKGARTGFPVIYWGEALIGWVSLYEATLSVSVDPGFLDENNVNSVLKGK